MPQPWRWLVDITAQTPWRCPDPEAFADAVAKECAGAVVTADGDIVTIRVETVLTAAWGRSAPSGVEAVTAALRALEDAWTVATGDAAWPHLVRLEPVAADPIERRTNVPPNPVAPPPPVL